MDIEEIGSRIKVGVDATSGLFKGTGTFFLSKLTIEPHDGVRWYFIDVPFKEVTVIIFNGKKPLADGFGLYIQSCLVRYYGSYYFVTL